MTSKEMIDDLLKRGKIEPNEHIAIQLTMAGEKIGIGKEYSKRTINGREIEYLDVIHHTTRTKFSFWDRIKILIGKEAITSSELYTQHEWCKVIGSEAKSYVAPLFIRKSKGCELTKI